MCGPTWSPDELKEFALAAKKQDDDRALVKKLHEECKGGSCLDGHKRMVKLLEERGEKVYNPHKRSMMDTASYPHVYFKKDGKPYGREFICGHAYPAEDGTVNISTDMWEGVRGFELGDLGLCDPVCRYEETPLPDYVKVDEIRTATPKDGGYELGMKDGSTAHIGAMFEQAKALSKAIEANHERAVQKFPFRTWSSPEMIEEVNRILERHVSEQHPVPRQPPDPSDGKCEWRSSAKVGGLEYHVEARREQIKREYQDYPDHVRMENYKRLLGDAMNRLRGEDLFCGHVMEKVPEEHVKEYRRKLAVEIAACCSLLLWGES